MKALYFEEFGGPDALRLGTMLTPDLVDGHLLIDVHCAGVNPIDWKVTKGIYVELFEHRLPIVTGFDFAGTVRAVGGGVSGFEVGDRVNGMNLAGVIHDGTYAEITLAPAVAASHIPDGMTFELAAAIPTGGLTAGESLFDFGALEAGQSVLIQAGAGGVGTVAVQLAKQRGTTVLTTARARDHDYVRALGADHVIDFEAEDFVALARDRFPDGLDLVVDSLGGEVLARGYETLREGGRMAILSGKPDPAMDRQFGTQSKLVLTSPNAKRLGELSAMLARGELLLPEVKVMDFADAMSALEESAAGNVRGKLVLKMR